MFDMLQSDSSNFNIFNFIKALNLLIKFYNPTYPSNLSNFFLVVRNELEYLIRKIILKLIVRIFELQRVGNVPFIRSYF